jgi:hypothetical protein
MWQTGGLRVLDAPPAEPDLRGVAAELLAERDRQGWRLSDAEVLRVFELDHELNAQGLGDYIDGRKS